jgi:hypothetical protein
MPVRVVVAHMIAACSKPYEMADGKIVLAERRANSTSRRYQLRHERRTFGLVNAS